MTLGARGPRAGADASAAPVPGGAPSAADPPLAGGDEAEGPDVPPVDRPSLVKPIVLAAAIILCVVLVWLLRDWLAPLEHFERPPWIDELRAGADEAGLLGDAMFVLVSAVAVSIGVPRLAIAFVCGAVHGWLEGMLLAHLGTFFGSWATFVGGRHLGHTWVQSFVARRLPRAKALLDFIARHGFEANVLLRVTPVGNAFATNLLFAVSTVRLSTFLAASFVGMLPQNAIAALMGSAAKGTEMASRLIGGSIALVVLGLCAAWWTRRLRSRGAAPAR